MEDGSANQVLVVGTLSPNAGQVVSLLPGAGFPVVNVPSWGEAQQALAEGIPAAILLPTSEVGDPYAAVKWVRAHDGFAFSTIVLFGAPGKHLRAGEGLAAGADEVIADSRQVTEVLECIVARIARAQKLRSLALHDPLTELHNRRYLNDRLPAEMARAERNRKELALAIVDLDEFKPINDLHGHASGDRALRAFGRSLRTGLRSYDQVCRYGGDEFLVLFPGCSAAAAGAVLSTFRSRRTWVVEDLPPFSFSAGVAEFPRDGHSPDTLFEAADRNLRRAKGLGRDSIVDHPGR